MSRGNLILAAIALLLAGLLWLDGDDPTPAAPLPLTDRDPQQVQRIALHLGARDEPAVLLQRQQDGWRLLEPVAVAADDFAVGEILRLLSFISHGQRDPAELDLSALKLSPPLWRVRYDDTELAFGAVESIRQRRYVLHEGRVHLVDDFNPGPIDGNYADLVSRRLLPEDTEIVEIRWPDTRITAAGELDPERLRLWLQAEADWTARPLPIDFDAVKSRVTVTTARGSLDFLISEREPRLKLIRPDIDVLYNLPGSAADELLPRPAQP